MIQIKTLTLFQGNRQKNDQSFGCNLPIAPSDIVVGVACRALSTLCSSSISLWVLVTSLWWAWDLSSGTGIGLTFPRPLLPRCNGPLILQKFSFAFLVIWVAGVAF